MGQIILTTAFIFSSVSFLTYLLSIRDGKKFINAGRLLFKVSVIAVIFSAVYLMYLIISHQFQFTYVWNYSSTDLPLNLLLSTFYAGQEGSFHLWALFTSIQGILLISYLNKKESEVNKNIHEKSSFESYVMSVYVLINAFLIFVLILKSPYHYIWESFSSEVNPGYIPPEGRGLNPLLQNFWMTIHPPVLFAGFAALAVPFSFAVSALLKNEYGRWMKFALPWTLYGGMILGAGLMLGGYWAYGVLGWGGYWAWDPVENSSLVPWILCIAGIHTMLAEEKTGRYRKTSLILCILAFATVLYSTFLTRSGILGDASVHSFVDPGQEVYLFLVIFLVLFGAGGIGLIIFRLKNLRDLRTEPSEIQSRESALFTGAMILCASSLVIAAGTSWPILSKGTVDMQFYNKMNLPLAIMVAIINGFSILYAWKHTDRKRFLKSLITPALISVISVALISAFVSIELLIAVFIAVSIFSLTINLKTAIKIISKNKFKSGAYIAHSGLMILFLGIIGSSIYSEEVNLSLPLNKTKEALGYQMTYLGSTPIENENEKYHFNVLLEKDGKELMLRPVMFYSKYSEGVMKNPDIANFMFEDVYLSPASLEASGNSDPDKNVMLRKGETVNISGVNVTFIDFDRSGFSNENMKYGKESIIGAELDIESSYGKEKITVLQKIYGESAESIPVRMKNSDRYTFTLNKINAGGEPAIELSVKDQAMKDSPVQPETLVLTASIKPMIDLVWAGTVIMSAGFIFSMIGSFRKSRKQDIILKSTKLVKPVHTKNGQSKKRELEKVH